MKRAILLAALATAASCAAVSAQSGLDADRPSAGPVFELDGTVLPVARAKAGTDGWTFGGEVLWRAGVSPTFELVDSRALGQPLAGSSCLCGDLFSDGFESGDTSAWSATAPLVEDP